jgi:hypothetical protein
MEVKLSTPTYGECFVSLALGMAPFFLLVGIAAVFGANTVTSGGQNVHGVGALVVCIVLGLVFPAIFAGVQKLGYLMLGVLRRKQTEVEA